MSVKVKYGTYRKWGDSWKYGNGTSEPWTPRETPLTVARFVVESLNDPATSTTPDGSTTPSFTSEGAVSPAYTSESP